MLLRFWWKLLINRFTVFTPYTGGGHDVWLFEGCGELPFRKLIISTEKVCFKISLSWNGNLNIHFYLAIWNGSRRGNEPEYLSFIFFRHDTCFNNRYSRSAPDIRQMRHSFKFHYPSPPSLTWEWGVVGKRRAILLECWFGICRHRCRRDGAIVYLSFGRYFRRPGVLMLQWGKGFLMDSSVC